MGESTLQLERQELVDTFHRYRNIITDWAEVQDGEGLEGPVIRAISTLYTVALSLDGIGAILPASAPDQILKLSTDVLLKDVFTGHPDHPEHLQSFIRTLETILTQAREIVPAGLH